MADTANLKVNADGLIARLRDKLAEAILQLAILETAVDEALARETAVRALLVEREQELAALRPDKKEKT